jgi:2-polyprenyl-3-methyl-5-hydroxy-6-metoxy-1,4-benzoquinol methylase
MDFYESTYGKETTDARTEAIAQLAAIALRETEANPIRFLEVGSGNGTSLAAVVHLLTTMHEENSDRLQVSAWDISQAGVDEAKKIGFDAHVRDITQAGLPSEVEDRYHLILFTEVLEHVVDTGLTMRNLHELLFPGGYLVMTTPNLAAWYNRIILLFGLQPHMTEVSFEPHRFGNRLFERLLGEERGKSHMAGHLRVFTLKALKEFTEYHDFKILKCVGVANQGDAISRIVARVWKGGAGDVALLARKDM